jgi:hypothetical protein
MSWVMVPTPKSGRARERGSPSAAGTAMTEGKSAKRSTPVASIAGSGGLSKRKVVTPHSQRHHYHRTATITASRASTTTPSSLSSHDPPIATSAASYASPRTTPTPNPLIAKRLREEREADRSIQRFNERLKEMIREGKEALGARWDVDLEDELVGGEEGEGV